MIVLYQVWLFVVQQLIEAQIGRSDSLGDSDARRGFLSTLDLAHVLFDRAV